MKSTVRCDLRFLCVLLTSVMALKSAHLFAAAAPTVTSVSPNTGQTNGNNLANTSAHSEAT